MAIRKTTQVGNTVIRARSVNVESATSAATRRIIRDLTDTMRKEGLVGMAAPQIGVNSRVFVTEVRSTKYRNLDELDGLRVFINPRITARSKATYYTYEGCGSVAHSGLFAKVRRHRAVSIVAQDAEGARFAADTAGLLAHIIQHEMDHLDGKVFLDREFDPKSLMSRNEYMEYSKRKRAKRASKSTKI